MSSYSTPIKSPLNKSYDSNGSFSSKLDLSGYNTSPATRPVGRDNKVGWYQMHQKHEAMSKRSNLEYVLCGDSIIAGLSRYSNIWREFFAPLHALNLGIGGDRTQHVLWRAENLDMSPNTKFVVLHCGTNNIDRDTPTCIANGILSIAVTFQEKIPGLKVVVTGLLPRDLNETFRRDKINKVNKIVKKMCRRDFDGVYYMKQDDDWLLEGGLLDESLYHTDHLHLIEKGNTKFATSIIDILDKLKTDGCVEYSSDESGDSDSDAQHRYQRLLSQKRKRDLDSDDNDYLLSRSQKRRRHSNDNHRRSSSHRTSSSSHRSSKHRHSYESSSSRDHQDEKESSSWKKARERGISSLKDKTHDCGLSSTGIERTKEKDRCLSSDKKSPVKVKKETCDLGLSPVTQQTAKEKEEQELLGTAKSIDITLDQRKRLEARKNKFSTPALLAPSSLMRKIQDSQKEARKHIDLKRKSIKHVSSEPTTEAPEEISHTTKMKKFFSDYTADSESE